MSPAEDEWRPPGSLDPPEPAEEPLIELDAVDAVPTTAAESEPVAPSRPAPLEAADLLRRAALKTPSSGTTEPVDDPDLWNDPAARRELRLLTRLGLVTGVLAAFVLPYVTLDGFERWPSLWVPVWALSAVLLCVLLALFFYGFFATLRRGAYLWLILGFVLTPLAYAAWAAVLTARIRRAALEAPGKRVTR